MRFLRGAELRGVVAQLPFRGAVVVEGMEQLVIHDERDDRAGHFRRIQHGLIVTGGCTGS